MKGKAIASASFVCLALSGVDGQARAQALRFDGFSDGAPVTERDLPNVVDRRGCIRMCEQDTAPCDPPIYKHADGRCTNDY